MSTERESDTLLQGVNYNDPNFDEFKLPSWLNELIPSVKEPYFIDYEPNDNTSTYVVKSPAGEVVSEHPTLEEAYDTAQAIDRADDNSGGLSVSSNVPEAKAEKFDRKMLSVPTDNSSFLRALMFFTDSERLDMLKYRYFFWLSEKLTAYETSPDDFMTSYEFLDGHPCFWTHFTHSSDTEDKKRFTFTWNTEGHALNFWHSPTLNNNGNIVFMMEAGSHVEPDYTHHYHDLRLDVYADSYENAIIEMAAKVHKFFAPDGSERENVEYEKSDLELTLEERAKDLDLDDKLGLN